MAGGVQSSNFKSTLQEGKNYTTPLIVVTNLFFIWAFVTNLNDILIPYLKRACELTDFQSSLVQLAFFIAYFFMSIPSAAIIKKTGYKQGILIGLGCMFVGALLFIPAATSRTYSIFLAALFILASGVTLLQVAANPYVTILGKPETASARLNLTQAFNSLGATIAPLIGGTMILSALSDEKYALFSLTEKANYLDLQAGKVIMTYVGLAAVILVIGLIIYFSNMPEVSTEEEETEVEPKNASSRIFDHKHLVLGITAIFLYVGAEVSIGSFIIRFSGMPNIGGLSPLAGAKFVSYYMLFAMIGRFAGSYFLSKLSPNKVLGFNAMIAVALLLTAIMTNGSMALYSVVLIGLCNSIMFPTIFTLAIKDLGRLTKQGSSYLVMAIVGGGFVPLIMGYVSGIKGIQIAFIVPAVCYVFISYYGFKGSRIKNQPIVEGTKSHAIEQAKTMANELPL
jgi:FHS family L-fucose permease-like MFS transporter